MEKVYITTSDPVTHRIYDKEEVLELFGDGFMEEYGKEIPEDLLRRYKAAYYEFWRIQEEIEFWK